MFILSGNPDNDGNIFDGLPDSEDCLEMATVSDNVRGLLNDYICTRPLPYICEMKGRLCKHRGNDCTTKIMFRRNL